MGCLDLHFEIISFILAAKEADYQMLKWNNPSFPFCLCLTLFESLLLPFNRMLPFSQENNFI